MSTLSLFLLIGAALLFALREMPQQNATIKFIVSFLFMIVFILALKTA